MEAAGDGQINALLVWNKDRVKQTRFPDPFPPSTGSEYAPFPALSPHRSRLAEAGYYDSSRRISGREGGRCFALPVRTSAVSDLLTRSRDAQTAEDPQRTSCGWSPMIPVVFNGSRCALTQAELLPSKSAVASAKTSRETLKSSLKLVLEGVDPPVTSERIARMMSDVPTSWERHGDLVVLPSRAFSSDDWREIISTVGDFWSRVARALDCNRLARDSEISRDEFRSSRALMLRGRDPWVEHADNGIRYVFDVTKVMFSSGNISEKLRVAEFDCRGEVVVDMYAGIGYFTLPYLVHGHADRVHACEWNPVALEGLRRGLAANGVGEKCVVHEGDCRKVTCIIHIIMHSLFLLCGIFITLSIFCIVLMLPSSLLYVISCVYYYAFVQSLELVHCCDSIHTPSLPPSLPHSLPQVCPRRVADRVNLGLIPSSEGGWRAACTALRPDRGGWLHVHGNVSRKPRNGPAGLERNPWEAGEMRERGEGVVVGLPRKAREDWAEYVAARIGDLLSEGNPLRRGWRWDVRVGRVGTVKSYAPCVDHVVVDVECRPTPSME